MVGRQNRMTPKQREVVMDNIRILLSLASKAMDHMGEVPPMFFIMKKDDMQSRDLSPYMSDKMLVGTLIKAIQMDPEVIGTIFGAEAWVTEVRSDSEEGRRLIAGGSPDKLPSEREDKKEVFLLLAETRVGTVSAYAPIIRSGDSPTLGPAVFAPEASGSIQGMLVGGFDVAT